MKTFRDFILECELVEGKVEWDNPKRPLQSGLTPREKNRAKRISLGIEEPHKSSFGGKTFDLTDKDYERYGKLKIAHDTEKDKKVPRSKRHQFKTQPEHGTLKHITRAQMGMDVPKETRGQQRRRQKDQKNLPGNSKLWKQGERQKIYHTKDLKEPKESFDYNIDEGIQPLPTQKMLRKIKQKSKAAQDAMDFRRENQSSHTGDSLERLKAFTKRKIAKKASQIKKMKTAMRTHDPVVGQFKELENKVKGRK
jgi:hypothetical protein